MNGSRMRIFTTKVAVKDVLELILLPQMMQSINRLIDALIIESKAKLNDGVIVMKDVPQL